MAHANINGTKSIGKSSTRSSALGQVAIAGTITIEDLKMTSNEMAQNGVLTTRRMAMATKNGALTTRRMAMATLVTVAR